MCRESRSKIHLLWYSLRRTSVKFIRSGLLGHTKRSITSFTQRDGWPDMFATISLRRHLQSPHTFKQLARRQSIAGNTPQFYEIAAADLLHRRDPPSKRGRAKSFLHKVKTTRKDDGGYGGNAAHLPLHSLVSSSRFSPRPQVDTFFCLPVCLY